MVTFDFWGGVCVGGVGGGGCMVGDLSKKQERSYSSLQSPLLGD